MRLLQRQVSLRVFVLCVAIAAGIQYHLHASGGARLRELRDREKLLGTDPADLHLAEEVESLKARVSEARASFVANEGGNELLAMISRLAQTHRLGPPVIRAGRTELKYRVRASVFDVGLTGSFPDIVSFLVDLTASAPSLRISEVSVERLAEQSPQHLRVNLEVNLLSDARDGGAE